MDPNKRHTSSLNSTKYQPIAHESSTSSSSTSSSSHSNSHSLPTASSSHQPKSLINHFQRYEALAQEEEDDGEDLQFMVKRGGGGGPGNPINEDRKPLLGLNYGTYGSWGLRSTKGSATATHLYPSLSLGALDSGYGDDGSSGSGRIARAYPKFPYGTTKDPNRMVPESDIPEDDLPPYEVKPSPKHTTNMQTMMHILKGNIGTGILAMPNAFMNAGIYVGLATLPMFAFLCTHCMHILTRSNRLLNKRLGCGMLEYQDVMYHCITIGPKPLRPYSQWAGRIVNVFLLITQFGFCCVYSLFVAENLSQFLIETQGHQFDFAVSTYLWMLLPFFILLSFIRGLKHLAIASSFANLLQSVGLMIVMFNLVQDLPPTSSVDPWGSITTFPLYMGTAIYAFEGIALVLPLQKEMKEPEALGGKIGVLNAGMCLVASMNTAIGFYGYLKFGDAVKGSITLNLPSEPLYQYCKLMFACAIFLSYAIQYYVPFRIIWLWVLKRYQLKQRVSRPTRLALELSLRAILVVMTISMAVLVPRIELFIPLVGALSSSCLALIFPPLIDICVRWEEDDISYRRWIWLFTKNVFIFLIGIFGFTTGTYASVDNIITEFRHPKAP